MSEGVPPHWIFRILDYVALGFILLATEELWRRPSVWYSWLGALTLGAVCAWFGDAAPIIRLKFVKWLRAPKDLTIALAENIILKRQLAETERSSKTALSIGTSVQSKLIKPQHNVQYIGFKFIHEGPFRMATLCFQNVPIAGQLMGKFERPRLRVIYYENSTGQEIADMCPVPWWDERDGITDISAQGRAAYIASYFDGKWTANEHNESSENYDSWNQLDSVELPMGEIRILALLSDEEGKRSSGIISGILTLQGNTASFQSLEDQNLILQD